MIEDAKRFWREHQTLVILAFIAGIFLYQAVYGNLVVPDPATQTQGILQLLSDGVKGLAAGGAGVKLLGALPATTGVGATFLVLGLYVLLTSPGLVFAILLLAVLFFFGVTALLTGNFGLLLIIIALGILAMAVSGKRKGR